MKTSFSRRSFTCFFGTILATLTAGCVSSRDTPLHRALWGGRAARVTEALNAGADVNAVGDFHFTPLHIAALNNDTNSVILLIGKGAQLESQLNAGVVEARYYYRHLIFSGVNLDLNPFFRGRRWTVALAKGDGFTPLAIAAQNYATECVHLLLQHRARVDARDWLGMTPLAWAALNGDFKTAQVLLSNGANPNSRSNDGQTPLHHAARMPYSVRLPDRTYLGHVDFEANLKVVNLLIEKGAEVNSKDQNGSTPLDHAMAAHSKPVDLLRQCGGITNAVPKVP